MQASPGHSSDGAEQRLAETLFYLSLNVILAVTLGTMLWGVAVLLSAALIATPLALLAILAMSWQRSPRPRAEERRPGGRPAPGPRPHRA